MSKLFLINEETPNDILHPPNLGKGLELSLRGPNGYGSSALPFNSKWIKPRHEWQARIQEQKERGNLRGLIQKKKLSPLYQARTNYCWANAVAGITEVIRLKQNQKIVRLSPASAAAQIKQYRNVGGWGLEAIQWAAERGFNTVGQWPANAIDRKYATVANREAALAYRVQNWVALQPRNLDQLVSLLLEPDPDPVAVGYLWWGHEVYACYLDWVDGDVAVGIRNSWGDWGDDGFALIQGNHRYPDDAVAALSVTAA